MSSFFLCTSLFVHLNFDFEFAFWVHISHILMYRLCMVIAKLFGVLFCCVACKGSPVHRTDSCCNNIINNNLYLYSAFV